MEREQGPILFYGNNRKKTQVSNREKYEDGGFAWLRLAKFIGI